MTGEHEQKPAPSRRPDRPSLSDDDREPVASGSEPPATENESGQAAMAGDPAHTESALDSVRRERDEYLDMLRRVQADFENYKKRMLRQQTDLLERAAETLVVKLLPVLDAFDLARAHLEAEGSTDAKALLAAAGLLSDTLVKEGLESFGRAGETFDPTSHEAVEHEPAVTATAEDGGADRAQDRAASGEDLAAGRQEPVEPVVTAVLRPGYRYKGRVVRPAMVKVRG